MLSVIMRNILKICVSKCYKFYACSWTNIVYRGCFSLFLDSFHTYILHISWGYMVIYKYVNFYSIDFYVSCSVLFLPRTLVLYFSIVLLYARSSANTENTKAGSLHVHVVTIVSVSNPHAYNGRSKCLSYITIVSVMLYLVYVTYNILLHD